MLKDNSSNEYIILPYNQVHYTEVIQGKKEGNCISSMMEAYDLSRYKIKQLLKGKIKIANLGKHSPFYDKDDIPQ